MIFQFYVCNCISHHTELRSFTPCANPNPPVDKKNNNIMNAEYDIYKKNGKQLVRGNVTVKEDVIAFMTFKSGVEKRGKVTRYNLDYKKITCKSLLFKILYSAIKIKYDPNTCKLLKGHYFFNDLDVNKLDQSANFVPMREMGIHLWYIGLFNSRGTLICVDLKVEMLLTNNK